MAKRICAVTFVTVLGAGLMLPVSDLSAGPRGGHRAAPPMLRAPVGKAIPRHRGHGNVGRAAARVQTHHPRRHFDRRLTGWWSYPGWYDGGYYDPSNYTMLHDRPARPEPSVAPTSASPHGNVAPPAPERIIHVINYRPGCSSRTELMPEKDGAGHPITVVRC